MAGDERQERSGRRGAAGEERQERSGRKGVAKEERQERSGNCGRENEPKASEHFFGREKVGEGKRRGEGGLRSLG